MSASHSGPIEVSTAAYEEPAGVNQNNNNHNGSMPPYYLYDDNQSSPQTSGMSPPPPQPPLPTFKQKVMKKFTKKRNAPKPPLSTASSTSCQKLQLIQEGRRPTPATTGHKVVTFRDEFDNLPIYGKPPPSSGISVQVTPGVRTPILNVTGSKIEQQQCHPNHDHFRNRFFRIPDPNIPLLIGQLPYREADFGRFWNAVDGFDVAAIVVVDELGNIERTSCPWPSEVNCEISFDKTVLTRTIFLQQYRNFTCRLVSVEQQQKQQQSEQEFIPVWVFNDWVPSSRNRGSQSCINVDDNEDDDSSKKFVPDIPHFFLDFLRAVIQESYFKCRTGRSILMLCRVGLDVAALSGAIMLLLHQACQQRHADVWHCVSSIRHICRCNVLSRFVMYEFIYDCLLQVMCATPTIMSGNFRRNFRDLLHRRKPLVLDKSSTLQTPRRDVVDDSNVKIAPIVEQFHLICELTNMYSERVRHGRLHRPGVFDSHEHKSGEFSYAYLFSYTRRKHFLAIRGPVALSQLFSILAKRRIRLVIWFSETHRQDELLALDAEQSGNNNRFEMSQQQLDVSGAFSTFEVASSTRSHGNWAVKIVQFTGWPAFAGDRPSASCRDFVATIRAFLSTCTDPDGCGMLPPVALYESATGSVTWRGAMFALAASLVQRMDAFLEVDIFRTAQLYKLFDPDSIVMSTRQFSWCFKIAWAAYQTHRCYRDGQHGTFTPSTGEDSLTPTSGPNNNGGMPPRNRFSGNNNNMGVGHLTELLKGGSNGDGDDNDDCDDDDEYPPHGDLDLQQQKGVDFTTTAGDDDEYYVSNGDEYDQPSTRPTTQTLAMNINNSRARYQEQRRKKHRNKNHQDND